MSCFINNYFVVSAELSLECVRVWHEILILLSNIIAGRFLRKALRAKQELSTVACLEPSADSRIQDVKVHSRVYSSIFSNSREY